MVYRKASNKMQTEVKINAGTIAKERVARKDGKQLTMPPKPDNYGPSWKPKNKEDIDRITQKMIEWGRLETSVNINEFPLMFDINPYRFKRIDDEDFQAALQTVKYRVSARNRALVNSRECDKDIYKDELYLLDQDYKESVDDKIAKRVAGAKQVLGNITIVDEMLKEE